MLRRRVALAWLALCVSLTLSDGGPRLLAAADTLPARLENKEFWALSQELSEPDGYFRSDNLLSNEIFYPEIMADLAARASQGGVYLGVGPEQNFNYIVRLRPRMVFITDIRRGNLHTHLMYKALFELSGDRAVFLSRLFSRAPIQARADAPVSELIAAVSAAAPLDEAGYQGNLRAIRQHLTATRGLPLLAEDLEGIDWVYSNFHRFGPAITYNSSTNGWGRGNQTTYADLMTATDEAGAPQSYLASEATFALVKDLEQRNLIVPVVGNFAGDRALKAVGQYIRARGAVVSAFYLSNVEQYLHQENAWRTFCANVSALPLDARSTFIRSEQGSRTSIGRGRGGLVNLLGPIQEEITQAGCAAAN
jgi:hypothetical protein